MKIGPCEFPEPILAALREKRLVVFAGAGVSKGAPAGLDDFGGLANKIADGTGEALAAGEREDSFLGKLKGRGVDVHARAARELSPEGCMPTALHSDLLRLWSGAEHVRIVTTNYDLLFEEAASGVFNGMTPECFRAPALPLGRGFNGIVHVHGSLTCPGEMVLTDADFGRAYLVEGWARRFLVDLFRYHTVLFVGYRHNDLIVSYLARGLPETQVGQRFSLVGESDATLRWRNLGIEPIVYEQPNRGNHCALYEGVACLSAWFRRSIFDWQRDIRAVAEETPPEDADGVAIVEYALKDASTTRFFTAAARVPAWLDWLDQRGHLDDLFREGGQLSERDRCLVRWLATHFAAPFPDHVMALLSRHKPRVHPDVWVELGFGISRDEAELMPARAWSRWIHVLLSSSPARPDPDCRGQPETGRQPLA